MNALFTTNFKVFSEIWITNKLLFQNKNTETPYIYSNYPKIDFNRGCAIRLW